MEITIKISEETGKFIRMKAEERDMGLADLAGDLLEEKVLEEYGGSEISKGRKNLFKMAGMFSSGSSDTSERMHELLYSADLDPAQGFGTDKTDK